MSESSKLTFGEVSKINLARSEEWHKGGIAEWSIADWAVAMAGEAGEVCNAVKKLRRLESETASSNNAASRETAIKNIATEIGDTFMYLDLLAQRLGLDISNCIVDTFNRVSIREGFPYRLRNEVAQDDLAKTNYLNALTIKQLEALKEEDIYPERIIYQTHVSGMSYDKRITQDVAESFIVVENSFADCGIIAYGWNGSSWRVNPRLRWLVRHFIEKENAAKQKLQNSYSDIPDKPGFNKVAVFDGGGVGLCYEDPGMEKDSEEIPWPSDWPDKATESFLTEKGFTCVTA